MKKSLLPLLLIGCAAPSLPEPAVSDLGIKTGAPGLVELSAKVSGREDADCQTRDQWLVCSVRGGAEVYTFAKEGHPAYPAGIFRGFVESEDGIRLEERGWYAGDESAAQKFFVRVKSSNIAPIDPLQ